MKHCWHPFDGDERSERGEDVICCNCGLMSIRWRTYPESEFPGHGPFARAADYHYDHHRSDGPCIPKAP